MKAALLIGVASASLCNPYTPRATVVDARMNPPYPQQLVKPTVDLEVRCPWQAEVPIEVFRPAADLLVVRPYPDVTCELMLANNTYALVQWTLDFTPVHFPAATEAFRAKLRNQQIHAVEVNAQFLALDPLARNKAVTLGYFIYNVLKTDVENKAPSLVPMPAAAGEIGALATLLPRGVEGLIGLMVSPHSTVPKQMFPAAAFQEVCVSAGGQTELYFFVDALLRGSKQTAVTLEESGALPIPVQALDLAEASPTPAARVGVRVRYTN